MGDLQRQNSSNDVAPNRPEELRIAHAQLVYGSSADEVLGDQAFIARWQRLYDGCKHATAYQSPSFVRAWYDTYRNKWRPVIVRSFDARGDLLGLWLLAYDASANALSHAGAHQAEYHAWLASPGNDAAFLKAAWVRIEEHLAFRSLRFKYLPSRELGDVLTSTLGKKHHILVKIHDRPLMMLDGADIQPLISKQSYKRRVNGLKRLGDYQFRRLTRLEELNNAFGDLILFYDFRQGAVNQSCPFREDCDKKEFLTNLFGYAKDEIYVTVAYLDQQPVAAFWGNISRKVVHLGMLIYSPLLAKYSLGKVHIAQLCADLRRAGFEVLDLTPGGDGWKDGFANSHDQVAEVILYRSRLVGALDAASAHLQRLGKRCLAKLGIDTATAKSAWRAVNRVRPKKVYRRIGRWLAEDRELRIYRADRNLPRSYSPDMRVRRNSLQDLLCFEPAEPWQTRAEFLSSSYARLEHGEIAYTVRIGDRLAHYGWMIIGQTNSFLTEVQQSIVLPVGSATLYDFYSLPVFRGQGLYKAALGSMLTAAFGDHHIQRVYISVLADNAASRHAIEAMGFAYVGSAHWRSRFGRVSRWADLSLTMPSTDPDQRPC